jgi:glutathione synthase/RimK-type ligase-like ATP-grasp enzyme
MPGGSLEQVIYRVDVLHQVAGLGIDVINSAAAIERAVDKFHALALMERAGLPVPRTIVAERYDDAMAAFEELGRDVVLKPLFGSEGRGMVRLSDVDLAHRAFRALELGRYVYYLQEFVPHGDGDVRAFVLGDRVLAAMRRMVPPPGSGTPAARARGSSAAWKSNVAVGARAEATPVTSQLEELALGAARALGTAYAGVDVLPAEDGRCYVIEVNSIPGWQALQTTTPLDIAGEIADYALARVRGKG